MAHLYGSVETLQLRGDENDSWRWTLSKNGAFTVISCSLLFGDRGEPAFIWKCLWRLKIPSKVLFFEWMACKEQLPMIDLLRKRGMILPNICSLCLKDEETVNHLLMHCPFAREIWEEILREVGISWLFPNTISDLFQGWNLEKKSFKKDKILWGLIYLAVCWSIWLERNNHLFENHAQPVLNVYK